MVYLFGWRRGRIADCGAMIKDGRSPAENDEEKLYDGYTGMMAVRGRRG